MTENKSNQCLRNQYKISCGNLERCLPNSPYFSHLFPVPLSASICVHLRLKDFHSQSSPQCSPCLRGEIEGLVGAPAVFRFVFQDSSGFFNGEE
jgi:hypothetical protein